MNDQSDFSDTVNRPVQYGFRSEPEDYEIVRAIKDMIVIIFSSPSQEGIRGDNETIMQRYHRLKHEVADLINDVEQVKVNKVTCIFISLVS